MRRSLAVGFLALFLTGCGRSSPEGKVAGMIEANDYTFVLLADDLDQATGGISSRSVGGQTKMTMGEHTIILDEGGQLTFNGKPAGQLKKGDKVIVDARGRLFVNDEKR